MKDAKMTTFQDSAGIQCHRCGPKGRLAYIQESGRPVGHGVAVGLCRNCERRTYFDVLAPVGHADGPGCTD